MKKKTTALGKKIRNQKQEVTNFNTLLRFCFGRKGLYYLPAAGSGIDTIPGR